MREIFYFSILFLFFVFSCLAKEDCEDLDAGVLVSGYNRNLTLYGAINGTLKLCQSFRVDLNMSWLDRSPEGEDTGDEMYGIHEVGEFQGVRGGAVGRFHFSDFGYQRLEWVSVGAGTIFHCFSVKIFR